MSVASFLSSVLKTFPMPPDLNTLFNVDLIVRIPDQKVVFEGDFLFTDFHPYLAEGDLK
jgi:hypothetical protein